MPTPQPATVPAPHLSASLEEAPKASPIPLAAASIMAYDGPPAQPSAPPSQDAPLVPLQNMTDGNFSFGDGMDLSTLGIDQLQSMINSTNDLFSGGAGNTDMSIFGLGDQQMTPGPQSEADKLLASLSGSMSAQQQQQMPQTQQTPQMSINIQPPSSTGDAQRDVDAILASFSAGQAQLNQAAQSGQEGLTGQMQGQGQGQGTGQGMGQDEFSFDFGADGADVDLSELVGLFTNASAPETRQPTPNTQVMGLPSTKDEDGSGNKGEQAQTSTDQASQAQGQSSSQLQPQSQPQGAVGQTGQPDQQQQQQQQQQPQQSQQQQPAPSQPPAQQSRPQQQLPAQQPPQTEPQQPANNQQQPPNPFEIPDMDSMGDIDMSSLGMAGMSNNFASSNAGNAGLPATNAQGVDNNGQEYGIGDINLDDFDFGNSGMPNVEGDEFESMFAEFK